MKKYVSILLAFLLWAGFAGCSDDENAPDARLLKVTESEVTFDFEGGTGYIRFVSELPVQASSTGDWCHVSVGGKEVTVTVDMNNRAESRSAQVIIKAGAEETAVPVYQAGEKMLLQMPATSVLPYVGGDLTLQCNTLHPIEVTLDDDSWLTCRVGDDGLLTFTAQPLLYVGERVCNVTVSAGVHQQSFALSQAYWKVKEGAYNCFANGEPYGTCLIEEIEENVYKIDPSGSIFDAPYIATLRGKEFVINFGQVIGYFEYSKGSNVVLCAYNKAGYLNPGSKLEYVAVLGVNNADGKSVLEFKDTGTWSGYTVDGLYYGLYDNSWNFSGAGFGAATDLVFVQE